MMRPVRWLGALLLVSQLSACATGYGSTSQPRGYLRFEVTPDTAELLLDEKYSGQLAGWVEGVVPVTPGVRRVTLRADGYISQRFDVEIAAHEEVTFRLDLEPVLELELDETDEGKKNRPQL